MITNVKYAFPNFLCWLLVNASLTVFSLWTTYHIFRAVHGIVLVYWESGKWTGIYSLNWQSDNADTGLHKTEIHKYWKYNCYIIIFKQPLILPKHYFILLQMPENIPQSIWKFRHTFEWVCHIVTLTRHQKFAILLPTQTISGICRELHNTRELDTRSSLNNWVWK